ncbi:MAG: uroporphyrinogen decarboxylase family protein [Armatimonadota bacterium]|nr:uroporphyrinogen decarboxylase family protein [Armatimonadota bacterium]
MTPRERVIQSIEFRETDIVPYHITFTTGARSKLADFLGDPDFETRLGNHLAMISHDRLWPRDEVRPGYFKDRWGVIWNRTVDKDIGCVDNQVLPNPSLDGWQPPEPIYPLLAETYPIFVEANKDKFRVASIGFSLFERAWTLRGFEQLLVGMIESPEFVHSLLDRITEVNLAQIDFALKHDVDCVRFGDDWGSQNGLIMGPALWREFIKPRIAKMYKRVRDAGKYVMIHCCGDVKAILPDLVECGLNIFNPFQPEVMDIFETKKQYYGQLSFFGGISVQRLLPLGAPDEVRRETRRLLEVLGKGGGYIASPSHDIPADVPVENMVAMIEVLTEQKQ